MRTVKPSSAFGLRQLGDRDRIDKYWTNMIHREFADSGGDDILALVSREASTQFMGIRGRPQGDSSLRRGGHDGR
jgi:hypothetical protein